MSVCAGPMSKTRGKRWCGSALFVCVLLCAGEPKEKSKGKKKIQDCAKYPKRSMYCLYRISFNF